MIRISIGPFVLEFGTKAGKARTRAHEAFDPLWQNGGMSRNGAYRWLAERLGMTREECHMSKFDEPTCRRVVEACLQHYWAAPLEKTDGHE